MRDGEPWSRAPVAQLDRASDFESAGRRFKSCRAHQFFVMMSRSGSIGVEGERAKITSD